MRIDSMLGPTRPLPPPLLPPATAAVAVPLLLLPTTAVLAALAALVAAAAVLGRGCGCIFSWRAREAAVGRAAAQPADDDEACAADDGCGGGCCLGMGSWRLRSASHSDSATLARCVMAASAASSEARRAAGSVRALSSDSVSSTMSSVTGIGCDGTSCCSRRSQSWE